MWNVGKQCAQLIKFVGAYFDFFTTTGTVIEVKCTIPDPAKLIYHRLALPAVTGHQFQACNFIFSRILHRNTLFEKNKKIKITDLYATTLINVFFFFLNFLA